MVIKEEKQWCSKRLVEKSEKHFTEKNREIYKRGITNKAGLDVI